MSCRCVIGFLLLATALAAWGQGAAISWEDCLAEAAKYHPDLIVARESVVQARESVNVAQGNQMPALDVSAGVSKVKDSGARSSASSVDLVGSVTVFDGGAKRAAADEARAQLASTRVGYRVISSRLRFDLRAAYIGLWQAQEAVNISQRILKIRQDSYKLVQLHFESGTEHRGSLKLSQAKLEQAQADVRAAQRDIEAAQTALGKAIGYPAPKPLRVQPLVLPRLPEEGPDFEAIAKAHPQVRQAQAAEDVAAAGVAAARADYWPTVSLSASVGRRSNDIPPRDNDAAVGATLNYPLFNGGTREAAFQRARSGLRAAQAGTLSTYNATYKTLEQSWTDLQDALENARVQQEFLKANTEREKIAAAQYNVGLTSYNDWTIIEDNLVATQQAQLGAQAAALRAWASWDQARGTNL